MAEDRTDEDSTVSPMSILVDLQPSGDAGSAFRVKNMPGSGGFRHNLVDRGKTLALQADIIEVVHGQLTADDDSVAATLLIIDFQFHNVDSSRRFQRAFINLHFAAELAGSPEYDPVVYDIAPKVHHSFDPTPRTQVVTSSGNLTVQAGPPGGMANVGGGGSYQKMDTVDLTDAATLTGTMRLERRPQVGGKDTARWTLSENPGQKNGIPTYLRTAILLTRKTDASFVMTIDIKAKTDLLSSIQDVWGRMSKDDPVTFDTSRNRSSAKFDVNNLRSVDLKALSGVTSTTRMSTIRTEGQSFREEGRVGS
jgi:hypothetical protein